MEGIRNINPYFTQRYYTNPYDINRPYTQEKNIPSDDNQLKPIVTAGILQGMAIALQKLSKWCGQKLMQGKEFTNTQNVKAMAAKMLNDNNLNGKISIEYIDNNNLANIASKYKKFGIDISQELKPVARGENAFYMDQLKLAVAPKNKPSLILHELGHAVNAHKGRFLKFLQSSRGKLAAIAPMLLLLDKFSQKSDNEQTFIEKHAGKIGFFAFLPTIIEEGLASLRGINSAKQIKQTLNNSINLKPLKRNYAFAWLTYLISGIIFGISTKLSLMENKNN